VRFERWARASPRAMNAQPAELLAGRSPTVPIMASVTFIHRAAIAALPAKPSKPFGTQFLTSHSQRRNDCALGPKEMRPLLTN